MGSHHSKKTSENCTEKVVELRKEFDKLKGGSNKRISVDVFARKVTHLSVTGSQGRTQSSLSMESVRSMFQEKEEIDFSDYLKFYIQSSDDAETRNVLSEFFKEIDNGDGFLEPDELIRLEAKLGKSIDNIAAQRIISEWDHNGDGRMDLEDYIFYKTNNIGVD